MPKLPFKLLAAYDHDDKCVQTYDQNISDHAEVRDLSNYNPNEVPAAEVLIGGPCQDFATCGPRHGLKSTRGRLYQTLIQYMEVHRPLVVIGKNVPGLANMKQGDVLNTMKQDISSVGYRVEVWTLFAPDYGVPQRRTRLFIVAVRENLQGFPVMPKRTHAEEHYRTTRWAIEDLEEITDDSIPNQSQYFRASRAKKGNGQGDETSRFSFIHDQSEHKVLCFYWPLTMTLTEGQVSDYKGAALLMDALPEARELLADRGYDADWFRNALLARGITPCIPSRKNQRRPVSYDNNLYKQRHKIEIMFDRLKDWRRIAMRYARYAHILSFRLYASQLLSYSISINEV